jgi:hypothetical protein
MVQLIVLKLWYPQVLTRSRVLVQGKLGKSSDAEALWVLAVD